MAAQVTTSTTTSMSTSVNPASIGQAVTYTAVVTPPPDGGTVDFIDGGAAIAGCESITVSSANGRAACSVAYWTGGQHVVEAAFSGDSDFGPSASGLYGETVRLPLPGYWLATRGGSVYGAGAAPSLGGLVTTAVTGPVVGIAGAPGGKGYWVVTANGTVAAFGDALSRGDLPRSGIKASDIVALAPTYDGRGYWLVGRDGGLFAFGDAAYHGSVPGLKMKKRVNDIVGMVAGPGGGYVLVGSDGGVFAFGPARFYGSLPGIRAHVHDIRAILPSSAGTGYVLVGRDGGAFVFGKGVDFHGSLPGEGVTASDIVGIALTPDNDGYFMAASDGSVFGFGDAKPFAVPNGLMGHLPVVAVAGT
jgi:hypothetical protein